MRLCGGLAGIWVPGHEELVLHPDKTPQALLPPPSQTPLHPHSHSPLSCLFRVTWHHHFHQHLYLEKPPQALFLHNPHTPLHPSSHRGFIISQPDPDDQVTQAKNAITDGGSTTKAKSGWTNRKMVLYF